LKIITELKLVTQEPTELADSDGQHCRSTIQHMARRYQFL